MWLPYSVFASFGAVVFIAVAGVTVYRLSREDERRGNLLQLAFWLLKGLIIPFALWVVMNLGVSWRLQAFMPQVQAAQSSGGNWIFPFLKFTAAGLYAISSYWFAVTLGWILVRTGTGLDGESRSNFRALCLTSGLGMGVPAVGLLWLGGWMTLGLAVAAVLLPIAGYAPTALQKLKMPPMYSRAIARMKFGKYAEAEWEIIRELEKAENDFNGWMLLADLYANQFNDLVEAEQIVLEVCDHRTTTPSQIAVALHKLADWHLKIGGDPDAARRALQVICNRLPRSHLAHMAELRSAQLPATSEELLAQRQAHSVPLPVRYVGFDAAVVPDEPAPDPDQAAALVSQLTECLVRNPNDIVAREKFARILAEPLGKVDMAIEQIELLLGQSGTPAGKGAEWLTLIAEWQLRLRNDADAARETMQRLVREHPESSQAFAAQRRLNLLAAEQKLKQLRRPMLKIVPDRT